MAKRGRKRKVGPRKPCGRLQQASAPGPTEEAIERRKAVGGPENVRNQQHGTLVGIWHMQGRITDEQRDAGLRLLRLVETVDRLFGGPAPPTAVSLDDLGGRTLAEDDEEAYAETMARYNDAKGVLGRLDQHGHHRTATLALVRNQVVAKDEEPMVRAALQVLANKAARRKLAQAA